MLHKEIDNLKKTIEKLKKENAIYKKNIQDQILNSKK